MELRCAVVLSLGHGKVVVQDTRARVTGRTSVWCVLDVCQWLELHGLQAWSIAVRRDIVERAHGVRCAHVGSWPLLSAVAPLPGGHKLG